MRQLWTITKKELRSYFGSPMAGLFIFAFLMATLLSFFWVDTFFARGIADVRPLFTRLPVLMIFLVAALTMRQWSEEQRAGTLEMLLTLPVSTVSMVVGKFLAVLILVAAALALTFFLPITVSMLGNLDWGPVVGGYLAALLLAAAYAAIGLFISSRTDNQIVSLIATVILCYALYLVGSATVTDFVGSTVGEILWAIGAGSRFESILRGVIDLRDLLYYLTLTGIFLALNVLSLKAKSWSSGPQMQPKRQAVALTSALLVVNLLLVNVWMYPLRSLRLDLTQQREYSLSPVTRELLRGLQDTLTIRGYFSEKTHRYLAPLVPTVRDMLREYELASGGRVKLELIDPALDPEREAEANQVYGIRPTPLQDSGRYEASIINSYFDILIQYGDQSNVLTLNDIIEVRQSRDGIEVVLRNLEYDLTSTIKKTVYGFQDLGSVLASLSAPVELTLYVTPKTLPEWLADAPATLEKVAGEIAADSNGKFSYQIVDPTAADSPITPKELYETYGLQPLPVALFSSDTYYLYMVVKIGEKAQVIYPPSEVSEATVRKSIESVLKRSASGFLTVVGLWTPPATPTQDMFGQTQQPISSWNQLSQRLSDEYEVQPVDLSTGMVSQDVDVLVLVAPQNLTEKELYTVDQYLMRGGAVVLAAGNYTIIPNAYSGGLDMQPVMGGVQELLAHYGVTVEQKLVMDQQNEPFPVQVVREVSGFQVQEIQPLDYPFFVYVQSDGMSQQSAVVSGLPAVTLNWASPVSATMAQQAGRTVEVLINSSPNAWAESAVSIKPDFTAYPETGFPEGAVKQRYPLAVSVQGSFASYFADRPSPFEAGADTPAAPSAEATPEPTPVNLPGTLKASPDTARLVVFGSAEFVDDIVLELSAALSPDRYLNNLQLVQNAIAWSTEDTSLLEIRARGAAARTLALISDGEKVFWERLNFVVALGALAVIAGVIGYRQRNEEPMELTDLKA